MEKTKHLTAEQLLNTYWSGDLPVDTMFMALNSKVRVMVTNKVRIHHIEVDEKNNSYIIFLSNSLPREFLYYTLAHCLGHIHCGHLEDARYLINDERYIQKFEEEANEYAKQLVMPSFALQILKENNITNTETMSQKFAVPEYMVKSRLSTN